MELINMKCEICPSTTNLRACSKCYSAFYCDTNCQTQDWNDHKTICLFDTTKSNPWFTSDLSLDDKYPNIVTKIIDASDIKLGTMLEYIKNIALEDEKLNNVRCVGVNTIRDQQCASLLHIAITHGDLPAIKLLVDLGAFVNTLDSRMNTPMYYACSHTGINEKCLNEVRLEIVKYLVSVGADTMAQGGFSGMRPHEAAKYYGYDEVSEFLESSPLRKLFCVVRDNINLNVQDKQLNKCIKAFIDVKWRSSTAGWLIQPNRKKMNQNFNPHPIASKNVKSSYDVEKLYQDCASRHNRYWQLLRNLEVSV